MADFDESEMIHSTEFQANHDQATRKFLRREFARLVETTAENTEKFDSMAAMMRELKQTLSQLSNQLGIRPIDAESSPQALPVTYSSDPSIRDAHSRFPLDNSKSLLPEFDGSNVSDWLLKVERFFSVGRYSDLDKLDLVAFSLEGDVLLWFDSEMTHSEFHSWDEFRRRLLLQFEATPENSSENVAEILEARASSQVPVPCLEPGLSFSSETFYVSDAWQSDMVSNNRLYLQSGFECVKNKNNAHHVFDELFLRRHIFQHGKKLSLSLKTWKFKFKNKLLQRNRSQMDPHHVIDSNIIKYIRYSSRAKFGYRWKEHNSRYWRRMRQTPMSQLLCNLRVRQDTRYLRHKWKSKHLRAVFDLQTSPSYALDVVNKTSKPWETQTTFTSTHVASVNSLSFAVGTANNFELCVGHETGIMKLKLLLQSGFAGDRLTELDFHISEIHGLLVFPWNLMLLEFFLFLHLEDKVCLSAASNSCYGWMVFDRGKNIKILGDVITLKRDDQTMLVVKAKDVHVDSLIVRTKVILSCGVALRKQIQWAEIQKLSLYKEFWIEIMDGDITKLLNAIGGPRDSPIQCFIKKNRATATYILYYGLMPYEVENYKLLLAARRIRRATCTDLIISLSAKNFSRSSNTSPLSSVIAEPSVVQGTDSEVSSLPSPKGVTSSTDREIPDISPSLRDQPLVLKNKSPRWHEQLQCWSLNFKGRVTVASVKNFQLVADIDASLDAPQEDHDRVILQFGKIGKDIFTMDYRYPLSAFQAFAICISSFDTKPACEG